MERKDFIDSYRELPIGKYLDICEIDGDGNRSDLEKQVGIIAVLAGMTENEVLKLPITRYKEFVVRSRFLEVPSKEDHSHIAKSYVIGDWTLVPTRDYRKITTDQYIDFQTYAVGWEKNLVQILSVFLVPKGKEYNEGYDVIEVQKAIRDNLSVSEVLSLSAFFFQVIESINSGFPVLFKRGGEEAEGQGAEEGDGGEDRPSGGSFEERWGWVANVDLVADTCRCKWDEVWKKTAIEFLNIISYRRDRDARDRAEIEEWKRRH